MPPLCSALYSLAPVPTTRWIRANGVDVRLHIERASKSVHLVGTNLFDQLRRVLPSAR